jgi:hypothetical protein
MLVLAGALGRAPKHLSIEERIGWMMKHAGTSILITSLTDMLAFALSTTTRFLSLPPSLPASLPPSLPPSLPLSHTHTFALLSSAKQLSQTCLLVFAWCTTTRFPALQYLCIYACVVSQKW